MPLRTALLGSLLLLVIGCGAPPSGPLAQPVALLPASSQPVEGAAWIAFTDKGPAADLDAMLLQAELELHPRALARRERNRPDGSRVGLGDLPVHEPYVASLEELGLEVRVRSRRLNAVSVTDLAGAQDALAALPFVASILPVGLRHGPQALFGPAPDAPREVADDPPPSPFDYGQGTWQAELVSAHELHGLGLTGAGVIVGATDTGFRLEHEALVPVQERVLDSWDFLEDDGVVEDETQDEEDINQDFHGTAVLSVLTGELDGTLVGIAPGISLLLAKTESIPLEEPFEEDVWIEGAEWVEANGADILTSSLGWTEWYLPEELDGATAVSTIFAEDLVEQTGLVVIVSAANEGPDPTTISAPADAASVLAIAAVDADGEVADFSSRGPTADGRVKPDLAAPGEQVTCAKWDEDVGLRTANGTSFAAPILAGVAALLLEAHPEWTREELAEALRTTASQATQPDYDLGWGIVDGWAACGLRCSCRDEDGDGFYADDCGGDDCDDAAADRFPGQEEACNGIDDDCDGGIADVEADLDGDGDLACATDCDDQDFTVDGVDHDGDGVSLCDGDCADGDPAVSPLIDEIPYDGIDQDCDGADLTDRDGDGFDGGPDGFDCADLDPSIYPDPPADELDAAIAAEGGHELCFDGRDNDCDGLEGWDDPDCRYEGLDTDAAVTSTTTTISSTSCTFEVAGRGSATPLAWLLAFGLATAAARRRRPRR
jgi:hypothetical protein